MHVMSKNYALFHIMNFQECVFILAGVMKLNLDYICI